MKYFLSVITVAMMTSTAVTADNRQLVNMPEMMQNHMLANMRDHLVAINEILSYLKNEQFEEAAETAENRLGMTSLESHGAHHMAGFMPEGMKKAGSQMHHAASRFAIKAQEGEVIAAYGALSDITAACVSCHAAYKIR